MRERTPLEIFFENGDPTMTQPTTKQDSSATSGCPDCGGTGKASMRTEFGTDSWACGCITPAPQAATTEQAGAVNLIACIKCDTVFQGEQGEVVCGACSQATTASASGPTIDAALVAARDAINGLLWQFTGTPSTLNDSNARAQGHAAIKTIDSARAALAGREAAPAAPLDERALIIAGLQGLARHVRAVPEYRNLLGDMDVVDKAIAALAQPAAPTEVPGLGRVMNDDDGYLILQFKDEGSAQEFMHAYLPSVEVDEMPPMRETQPAAPVVDGERSDWTVGNLLTMSDCDYPGMGGMFAQVWQGDDLIARVYGDSADEVRERAACFAAARSAPVVINKDDVEWVVNDLAELGVKIGNQFFFLYKGDSLQYETGKHDDGTPMRWRPVGKREFGECCHPVKFWKDNTPLPRRYTDELVYTPGLSFGQPGDADWRDLPASVAEAGR